MSLPKEILSRKEEITAGFLQLMEDHVADLLSGRITYLYHARHFADKLCIHPRHLTNTIKHTTGRSPCDFMEQRILSEAQLMLRETKLPVSAIGYWLGYSEPTNFVKFFKLMSGTTPLRYRKEVSAVIIKSEQLP